MVRNKNPQEFFEVFKAKPQNTEPPPASKEKPDQTGSDAPRPPKQEEVFRGIPAITARPQRAPVRNAEVTVTPGKVTVSLTHTGLVLVMAFIAAVAVVSFVFGTRYARRSSHVPRGTEVKADAGQAEETGVEATKKLGAWDMTPAGTETPSKPAAAKPGAAAEEKKESYCLELIAGISKESAEEIAKTLSVNWKTEVIRTPKGYGVRIGYWGSPGDWNAQKAQEYFSKQKQFKGCYFRKVESR